MHITYNKVALCWLFNHYLLMRSRIRVRFSEDATLSFHFVSFLNSGQLLIKGKNFPTS